MSIFDCKHPTKKGETANSFHMLNVLSLIIEMSYLGYMAMLKNFLTVVLFKTNMLRNMKRSLEFG